MAEIHFDEARHEYRIGGRLVPSVTQVLSILQDLGGVPAEVLERAAEFGTHVHQAVDLWNKGSLDEDALDPALAPYLADWQKFVADTGAEILGSEIRVYHPGLKYAGTLDTLARIRGKVALIDIKSGVVPRTVGPQLAAYETAYSSSEDNEHAIRRRLCVQLTGDGYRLHECKNNSDWSIFQSALNIWRFRNV